MHDIKVDTRELYKFDNILDFIETGLEFRTLDGTNTIFTRTAFLLLDMHGEICWHCSKRSGVSHVHEMSMGQFRDNFMLLKNGVCPHCKRTRFDLIREQKWTAPHTGCLMLGQRSGKDFLGALALLYAEHRLQVLEKDDVRVDPHEFYSLRPGKITCTCVGTPLSNSTFLDYAHTLRSRSEWFQTYFTIIEMYEAKHGIELHKNTKYHVRYHNDINVFAELAASVPNLRGSTRFMTYLPESSWVYSESATSDTGLVDMLSVHDAVSNGSKTMRNAYQNVIQQVPDAPSPLILTATSPRALDDLAHTLERKSYFDRGIYFARHPTWEVNHSTSKETLLSDKGTSMANNLRDFACLV